MLSGLLQSFFTLLALAVIAGIGLQRRFGAQLKRLEASLTGREKPLTVRDDLPPQVVALAGRQGATGNAPAPAVRFTQHGAMWEKPGASEMRFTATQVMVADEPSFVWQAKFAPLGVVMVADYFVAGTGGLDGRVLGIYPLMRHIGGDEIAKGELMRYIAELPLNPDAMLANRALSWEVIDERTLKVAAGEGRWRCAEVTLRLNADGFVESAEAADRPRIDGKTITTLPWRGRFSDYREMGGRIVPTRAEVAWLLDGDEFVYWRGKIDSWTPLA